MLKSCRTPDEEANDTLSSESKDGVEFLEGRFPEPNDETGDIGGEPWPLILSEKVECMGVDWGCSETCS